MMKKWAIGLAAVLLAATQGQAACSYFVPRGQEITQTAQKVFIDWDAEKGIETLIFQPSFEGDAAGFGLILVTPGRPTVAKAPPDFFAQLEVFTVKKRRAAGVPQWRARYGGVAPLARTGTKGNGFFQTPEGDSLFGPAASRPANRENVKRPVEDVGVLGVDRYQVFAADSKTLMDWLRKYDCELGSQKIFTRDVQDALEVWARRGWCFTLLKVDSRRLRGGQRYKGQVAPIRLQFRTERPVYPLRMAGLSAAPLLDVQFYLQGTDKMDLAGDLTYQYQWAPMIRKAERNVGIGNLPIRPRSFGGQNLPGGASQFINAVDDGLVDRVLRQAFARGFVLNLNGYDYEPRPGKDGKVATLLQWAKRLTANDLDVLAGKQPYSDRSLVRGREAAGRVTYVRLPSLEGYLRRGGFLTRLDKKFIRSEMASDVVIVPARLGSVKDDSEYEEFMPTASR
ncbi:MAG TPA: DUF2330 domain-containing protein [Gemmataceae bacterium]|nr:DUF2330 domain-containing protein [Gemmataceae bacterium]